MQPVGTMQRKHVPIPVGTSYIEQKKLLSKSSDLKSRSCRSFWLLLTVLQQNKRFMGQKRSTYF